MMNYGWYTLVSIVNPKYWVQNYPVNKEYDKFIREQLKNPIVTEHDGYYCKINGVKLWVESYPFAFGRPSMNDGMLGILPKRSTRIAIKKILDKECVKLLNEQRSVQKGDA